MSGGRFDHGSGRGGRGSGVRSGRGGYGGRGSSGRGNFRRNNTGGTSENIKKEFAPHQAGKQQKIACDSMKEHVIVSTQKNCKNGGDLALTTHRVLNRQGHLKHARRRMQLRKLIEPTSQLNKQVMI